MVVIHFMEHREGVGGVCDEAEDNNDFEYIQIIDMDRYNSYINRP